MGAFNKKIPFVKHSVVKKFIPFLNDLESEYGEWNVLPGYYGRIRGNGRGVHACVKYYEKRT